MSHDLRVEAAPQIRCVMRSCCGGVVVAWLLPLFFLIVTQAPILFIIIDFVCGAQAHPYTAPHIMILLYNLCWTTIESIQVLSGPILLLDITLHITGHNTWYILLDITSVWTFIMIHITERNTFDMILFIQYTTHVFITNY